jgi:hypothetical protein
MRARMLGAAALATLALAAPAEAGQGEAAGNGTVTIDVAVKKFSVAQREIVGRGVLTATLSDDQGNTQTARRGVRFAVVAQRARCSVLTLTLEDLQLDLLGLRVDTSAVNLRIFAIPRGEGSGVLGRLFCALSRSTIRLRGSVRAAEQARQTVRALNTRLERRPMRAFRATAALAAGPPEQAQAQPTCRVLNLLLGPLDLNLLGLVVELFGDDRRSPVRVTITAFPGQGAIGDLFCQLAGGPR